MYDIADAFDQRDIMRDQIDQMRKAVKSAADAAATWAGDWSTDQTLAWVYGIICGWDRSALEELAAKWGWDEETVERLRRYNEDIT